MNNSPATLLDLNNSPATLLDLDQARTDTQVKISPAFAAEAIVTGYADAKANQDVESALSFCTANFRLETVPFGLVAHNKLDARSQLRFFFHLFPDYQPTLNGWTHNAHGLACWGTIRMTMRGGLFGIRATGRTAELPFYCIFTLRGDRLASEHFFFDFDEMCSQLGVAPRRISALLRAGNTLPPFALRRVLALGRALGGGSVAPEVEPAGRALTAWNLTRAALAYTWRGRGRSLTPLFHLGRYARAFEQAFRTDSWSKLGGFFTTDASRLVHGDGLLAIQSRGRDAVVSDIRKSVDDIDRRFDRRIPELLAGPVYRDGGIWFRWRLRLEREGIPDLVVDGDHLTVLRGSQIASLEEHIPAHISERVASYMIRHADALRPVRA